MALADVERALRVLGGRATPQEIQAYLEVTQPRWSWSGVSQQLHKLERRGIVRMKQRPQRNRSRGAVWELVQ
jgi:Mn-dependent DtxR family transcriptional regulator